jgi:hypothetical protein
MINEGVFIGKSAYQTDMKQIQKYRQGGCCNDIKTFLGILTDQRFLRQQGAIACLEHFTATKII